MYNELKELLKNSKSKYYNFRVASILVCDNGEKYYGVNVETSSPGASICAERNALYSAISHGKNKEDFKELHVMVDSNHSSSPCFICRQALVDYLDENTQIFLYSKDGFEKIIMLKDLTPYPFSKEDLR